MKTLAPLLLMLLAAGCQSPNHWQAPARGPTATLVFTSNRIAAQPLVCRPGQGLVPTRKALAATPADPNPFNGEGEQPGRVRVTLPAGEAVVVAVRFEAGQRAARSDCRASARFTPAAGGRYRADFVMPGRHCGLSITDARNRAVADTRAQAPACP